MSPIVWLSGRYLNEARARLPLTSALLLQGVGLFETMRIQDGGVPLLPLHLERLHAAAEAVGLPRDRTNWEEILATLAQRNRITDGRARVTVGPDVRLATVAPLPRELDRERRQGISLTTARLQRPLADLKTTSRLSLWLAERRAGGEVLLVSARGRALETSRSNFFVLRRGALETATPPRVLPGIVRALVLEVARELSLPVRRRAPQLTESRGWQEVFVTNALRGLRRVRDIDGRTLRAPGRDSPLRELASRVEARMGIR
ncbi:MAG: aminotransferase class IV [Myxococcota bacterium]